MKATVKMPLNYKAVKSMAMIIWVGMVFWIPLIHEEIFSICFPPFDNPASKLAQLAGLYINYTQYARGQTSPR